MKLIYGLVVLFWVACSVTESEPLKRDVLDGSFTCKGRDGHSDSINFNVKDGFAKGEFYLPNSYYGNEKNGSFSGVMSESPFEFKVYGGVYVKEDVVVEENYIPSEYGYVYQDKYSVDSLLYTQDTIIYSHAKIGVRAYDSTRLKNYYYYPSYDSLTFDEDTLIWKAIRYKNEITYENQEVLVDSVFGFSEAKGDFNNEFRLREFESVGLFENEGYWIDCKRVTD